MSESTVSGLGRREILKLAAVAGATFAGAGVVASAPASAADDGLSLKGKRVAISATGTDHYFDLQVYNAQIEEVKRLGGEPIAVDAGRNDGKLIAQLQTLVAQKPDAIVQILGTLSVIDPWLKKARDAGIPVLTVDVGSTNSLNNTTSDNWGIGKDLALQLVSDIGGEGNIVVFNGFYGVTPCAIRYDQLVNVIKYFPKVKIIQPELRDVIPNTVQDAFTQITAILNKYPEKGSIKAVWSAWDIPQLGATQAIAAAGRNEIRTYGVDGSPEVLQLVADPKSPAGADAAQQPAEIGRVAIRNVAKLLAGQTLPRETYVPALLANKENVGEITKKLGIG
ncbi:sugar ABC transporter substrate-binding protein [Rhizobium grahamii]|uniref:Sugar ABC transporter substrate-binding protein n=1 Tax=Rhizobium grahamii TaxID=1120045 RepID=A0A370KPI5_9HYPH|nr:sugar ABC transporter substrate-binding protein [Rhizobium grahamii]RDJ11253.1 sugar ABC transporter substrate-binding protein [Rhizobium grahamii]